MLRPNARSSTVRASMPFTDNVDKRNRRRRDRHQSEAWAERDDVVEVRGIAQRAAEIAAVGKRQHAGRNRHAAPPLDPPAVLVGSYGFRWSRNGVVGLRAIPNSGTLVLPMGIAPARLSRSTITESASGMKCLKIGEPLVCGKPTAGSRSLNAIGSPYSGPFGPPSLSISRSARSARARHSSSSSFATMALSLGLRRAICFRNAVITSRADTLRASNFEPGRARP